MQINLVFNRQNLRPQSKQPTSDLGYNDTLQQRRTSSAHHNESVEDPLNVTKGEKIQQKLDAQNERLQYLDNYRVICEKRIRELAPSHPLPILPSHCGQPNPDIQELMTRLQMSYQSQEEPSPQNMEVMKLRSQIELLLQEKHQLEISLRDETLANEEQRNYIEILRNTIDQKLDIVGLGELLNFKNLPRGQDPISVYSVITELKKEADTWKKEFKIQEEKMQQASQSIKISVNSEENLKQQINERIQESHKLQNEVQETRQQLVQNIETMKSIDQEKNQLLDYIEENVKSIDKLNKDLESEVKKVEKLEVDKQELRQRATTLEESKKTLSEKNIELEALKQDHEDLIEQMKIQIRNLKRDYEQKTNEMEDQVRTIRQLQETVSQTKDLLKQRDIEIGDYRLKVRALEDDCMKLDKDREKIYEERLLVEKRAKIEEESLRKRIQMHEEFSQEQEERSRNMDEKHKLEMDLLKRTSDEQIKQLDFEKSEFRQGLQQSERENTELRKLKEQYLQDNSELSKKNTELNDSIEKKRALIESCKEDLQFCQSQLEKTKNLNLQIDDELQVERQRREWLSQEREKLSISLYDTKARLDFEVKQKEQELRKTENLEKEINDQRQYLGKELNNKTDEVITMHRTIDHLTAELRKTQSNIDYITSIKAEQESKMSTLEKDFENLNREKKNLEKHIKDLKDENQHLYRNEDRVKRLIEENESIKAQLRQKERDLALMNDKILKTTGEVDLTEKESKRVQKELSERELHLEAIDRQRNDLLYKLKDLEKRMFELHREKTEIESRFRVSQKQLEDVVEENDELRRNLQNSDEQRVELIQQAQKLRSKMTDTNISNEHYTNDLDEIEMISKQLGEKIKSFLDELLQKVQISDILNALISRHSKEQSYLLIQNIDKQFTKGSGQEKSKNIVGFYIEIKNFILQFTEEYNSIINEFLTIRNENFIMQKKIEQLESRLGNFSYPDNLVNEKSKYLQNEIENQKSQRLQVLKELNSFKEQDSQKISYIQELQKQVQELSRENLSLTQKSIKIETKTLDIQNLNETRITTMEQRVSTLKHKELKVGLLSKQKKTLEDLIVRAVQLLKDDTQQRIFTDFIRVLQDKYKAESERIKNEIDLDQLEEQLTSLIKGKSHQNDSKSYISQLEDTDVLRAQSIRREINEIESRVNDCDSRIDQCQSKSKVLEAQLKETEEKDRMERFSGISANQNTKTVNYLTKESQELRNEIIEKNVRIRQLEDEIENIRFNVCSGEKSIENIQIGYQSTATLPPKQRNNQTSIGSTVDQSILHNTFERRLQENQNVLSEIKRQFSVNTTAIKPVNLQPIKVEDYDYQPQREGTYSLAKENFNATQNTIFSLKPVKTNGQIVNARSSSSKPLIIEQDCFQSTQNLQSPPSTTNYNRYFNDPSKENINHQTYFTNRNSVNQTQRDKIDYTTQQGTPLEARLKLVKTSNININSQLQMRKQ